MNNIYESEYDSHHKNLKDSLEKIKDLVFDYEQQSDERYTGYSEELKNLKTSGLKIVPGSHKSEDEDPFGLRITELQDQLRDLLYEEEYKGEEFLLHSDPKKINSLFINLNSYIDRAKEKDRDRMNHIEIALNQLKFKQQEIFLRSIEELKVKNGFNRLKNRAVELTNQISKTKAIIAEKEFELQIKQAESNISAEELRLKFEADTERTIRNLLESIEKKKSEIHSLSLKQNELQIDIDRFKKEISIILYEIEKEEKGPIEAAKVFDVNIKKNNEIVLNLSSFEPSNRFKIEDVGTLFETFPFLTSNTKISDDMVNLCLRYLHEIEFLYKKKELETFEYEKIYGDKKHELKLIERSEENKALNRLKRMIENLEFKINENIEKILHIEKTIGKKKIEKILHDNMNNTEKFDTNLFTNFKDLETSNLDKKTLTPSELLKQKLIKEEKDLNQFETGTNDLKLNINKKVRNLIENEQQNKLKLKDEGTFYTDSLEKIKKNVNDPENISENLNSYVNLEKKFQLFLLNENERQEELNQQDQSSQKNKKKNINYTKIIDNMGSNSIKRVVTSQQEQKIIKYTDLFDYYLTTQGLDDISSNKEISSTALIPKVIRDPLSIQGPPYALPSFLSLLDTHITGEIPKNSKNVASAIATSVAANSLSLAKELKNINNNSDNNNSNSNNNSNINSNKSKIDNKNMIEDIILHENFNELKNYITNDSEKISIQYTNNSPNNLKPAREYPLIQEDLYKYSKDSYANILSKKVKNSSQNFINNLLEMSKNEEENETKEYLKQDGGLPLGINHLSILRDTLIHWQYNGRRNNQDNKENSVENFEFQLRSEEEELQTVSILQGEINKGIEELKNYINHNQMLYKKLKKISINIESNSKLKSEIRDNFLKEVEGLSWGSTLMSSTSGGSDEIAGVTEAWGYQVQAGNVNNEILESKKQLNILLNRINKQKNDNKKLTNIIHEQAKRASEIYDEEGEKQRQKESIKEKDVERKVAAVLK